MTQFLFGCVIGSMFTLSAVGIGIYAAVETQRTITAFNPVNQFQEWIK